MDKDLNITYIILDGHVELNKYRYLYFTIVLIVYVFIICSNCTIVYLIWKHPNLHEPMYIFIAALLLNSLLFSTNIYPKLLIDFLSEKQIISFSACLLQFYVLYSLADSEFLLLAAMSYDRYVSICKPLQYPTIMRKQTVGIFLAIAWLLPAVENMVVIIIRSNQKLCSFTLSVVFCNNTFYKLFCETPAAQSAYGVFILVNSTICPVVFILFTYARILVICYRSRGEVRKKAAQTCLPHLLVMTNIFYLTTYDIITARMTFDVPKMANLFLSLQFVLYSPLFNPIIYGLNMKEISKHLKRLSW